MRSFRRALIRLLLILTALVTVIGLTLGGFTWWAATHPDRAYALAQRYLFPPDLKITWGSVSFKPRRITWLHWAVDLDIQDLHVVKGTPRLDVPVELVGLSFELSVWRPATRADFARVTVRAPGRILYESSGESESTDEEPRSPFAMAKKYLDYLNVGARYATVNALDIDLHDVEVLKPGGDKIKIVVSLLKPPPERPASTIALRLSAESAAFKVNVTGEADASHLGSTEAPVLKARVDFEGFKVKEGGDLVVNFANEIVNLTFDGEVVYGTGASALRFKPNLLLSITARLADLKLKTSATGLPAPIGKIDPIDAHLEIPVDTERLWSKDASKLTLTAPLPITFVDAQTRQLIEQGCACRLPIQLRTTVEGSLWLDALFSNPRVRRPGADVRVVIDPIKNSLFSLNLAARVEVAREKDQYLVEPTLESDAHLNSYKTLRNLLDKHNVLIPAPFDVLDGSVDVVAHNLVKRDEAGTETGVDVKLALGSEHQKIDLRSNVTLKLSPTLKNLDVLVKVLIDAFQIQLPPLEPLAGLPPMAHDARVIMTPPKPEPPAPKKKPADAFKVQMTFAVKTTTPGSIRLLSELAKPHVPISVNIDRAANGDLNGQVQLEPFQISYLRRTVHVEHLRVLLDERDANTFPVDGRFRIEQTQYKVFVDVSGTVRTPSIRLTSEPYLPRNEIISVLLYDRTSKELVSGDAETAGSFEAAMADRAIGLFGLWAFASTPIRSFSYNPVTKVYSATVQLADGLTAGVGTNWEEAASFEVRKRVSRRWVLTASWSPSEVSTNQVGKLVLQWEKRF